MTRIRRFRRKASLSFCGVEISDQMFRTRNAHFVASIVGASVCMPTHAMPERYRVIPLGELPGSSVRTRAYDINSPGQVAGMRRGQTWQHAFRWDITTGVEDLGPLCNPGGSTGEAINDFGHVAGVGQGVCEVEAFLWT